MIVSKKVSTWATLGMDLAAAMVATVVIYAINTLVEVPDPLWFAMLLLGFAILAITAMISYVNNEEFKYRYPLRHHRHVKRTRCALEGNCPFYEEGGNKK